MGEIEIIPPRRPAVRTATPIQPTPTPPRVNTGGILNSKVVRWHAENQARALTAIAARSRAEADLYDAQTQAFGSYIKRQEAAARLQELPEIIAADRIRNRAAREEELHQLQHKHELSQLKRQTEVARAEATLEDARQALRAQQEHGYSAYELEWKRRQCESLDVELSAEERREILREHRARQTSGKNMGAPVANDEVTNALFDARTQMRASGLDTTRIDVLLQQRAKAK